MMTENQVLSLCKTHLVKTYCRATVGNDRLMPLKTSEKKLQNYFDKLDHECSGCMLQYTVKFYFILVRKFVFILTNLQYIFL